MRQCSDLRQRASTEPFQSQLGTGEKWRTVLLELYTGTSFLGGCTLTGTSFADLGSSDDQMSAGPRLKQARHFSLLVLLLIPSHVLAFGGFKSDKPTMPYYNT